MMKGKFWTTHEVYTQIFERTQITEVKDWLFTTVNRKVRKIYLKYYIKCLGFVRGLKPNSNKWLQITSCIYNKKTPVCYMVQQKSRAFL